MCLRPQGASQSASEKSGILCSLEGPLETPLHLVECKRDSSRVEAGTSVFLSISDSDRKVPACWYRRVRPRLFWRMGLLLPLELFSRLQATCRAVYVTCPFFRMMHRCVSAPSCCTFILKAAFQEVSEHRILIKSGPGNWSLSASGTTHKATYRISP